MECPPPTLSPFTCKSGGGRGGGSNKPSLLFWCIYKTKHHSYFLWTNFKENCKPQFSHQKKSIFFKVFQGNGLKNKIFTKNIIAILLNNFIWANRKGGTKLYYLTIGRNKIVHHENILDEMCISLFSCFLNAFPGVTDNDAIQLMQLSLVFI